MKKQKLIILWVLIIVPFFAKAQIENKTKGKTETVAKSDSTPKPQVLSLTMVIFWDSTWGRGGMNMRMEKTNSTEGSIPKVFSPLNINSVQLNDLICEFYDANATIIVREIMRNPLHQSQDQAEFVLKIQKELNPVKLEIRRVKADKKTEKLGSFKLVQVPHDK
ncbi:MAG: hypothetical protein JNL70_26060 [Saprospiraceae bacterium]|nr:hypothetical protein [Saprospiraceae bacterium]